MTATPRTKLHRHPERARTDRAALLDVLDQGLVAHLGVVVDGTPLVLPMVYAHDGEWLYLHSAGRGRIARVLNAGADVCVTITLLDGLVLADRAFNHSMNYRSAVVFGRCEPVRSEEAKRAALDLVVEAIAPGRRRELPPHTPAELRATNVVRLPLTEVSVKVRSGGPLTPARPGGPWTGVVPLQLVTGDPVPQT